MGAAAAAGGGGEIYNLDKKWQKNNRELLRSFCALTLKIKKKIRT